MAVQRLSSARPFRLLAVPIALAVPAALAGALVTRELGDDLLAGLAGAALAALSYVVATFVFRRQTLLDTAGLLRRSVRAGLGRDRPLPVPSQQPG
jgi:hypothetical protein